MLNMDKELLKQRKVRLIDIAHDKWNDTYNAKEDPKVVKGVNRGPLAAQDWIV